MGQGPSTHRGQSALAASPPTTQKPKEPPGKDEFSKDSPRRSRGALIANESTAIVTAAFPPVKLRWQPYAAIPLGPPRRKKDTPPPRHYARCGGKYCIPLPSSEVKNAAIQTRKPRVQSRATQTEAEALPLPTPAPLALQRIIRLVLFLAAVSLLLTLAAGLPGAHARPLTVGEHFPTSTMSLFRSFVSGSLVVVISKFLVTHVSAAVTTIPDLPEPTTAVATIFVSAIAAGYLLVRQPRPDTEEAVEVVDEEERADERWVPFLRDIAAPEYVDIKKGLINDRHNKSKLREVVIALYARLQASLDLGNRQKEFIPFLNDNPPWRDILTRLSLVGGKKDGDWLGAIQKAERWCKYAEVIQNRISPLFPDIPEDERTANRMYQQVDDLRRLRYTVVRNAAGHFFAHGLPVNTEKIEDLQHWVDAAPRELEKNVAMLFSPQPATRNDILDTIQKLIAGERKECSHPQELSARMRNEVTTTW